MSSTTLRTRIARSAAVALATGSVVAALAAAAPGIATAKTDTAVSTGYAAAPARSTVTFITAPNQDIVAANGVSYRYRRYGNPTATSVPLVFFQHFRGTLDNWDPLLI